MKRLLHKRQPFSSKGATVAQLVAQRIRNAWVAGSSPARSLWRKKKISPESKENQEFPAVWGDFFILLRLSMNKQF